MDAKITKERLGNFLSYEWIKMILAGAGAVFVVILVFTMIATRCPPARRFSVYGYYDITAGTEYSDFVSALQKNFSYEMLDFETENFSTAGEYKEMMLETRRSTGDGDAMFISNAYDAEGNSYLSSLIAAQPYLALDPEQFLRDCESYLNGFFGDYRTGELNEEAAKNAFLARNTGDKRFKTPEQIALGIEQEKARLLMLRDDLKGVTDALERGVISITSVTVGEGEEQKSVKCAIHIGNLKGVSNLYSYTEQRGEETVTTSETLNVVLFNNNGADGEMVYDCLSFLNLLVEKYEA